MGAFIDFLFMRLWQTGTAIEPLSRSPGASGEGKALCSHCFTTVRTRQRAALDWVVGVDEMDSISTVGCVREKNEEKKSARYLRTHIHAYTIAHLAYPKVMQEKCVRGSEGRESRDQRRICELCCISASRQSC